MHVQTRCPPKIGPLPRLFMTYSVEHVTTTPPQLITPHSIHLFFAVIVVIVHHGRFIRHTFINISITSWLRIRLHPHDLLTSKHGFRSFVHSKLFRCDGSFPVNAGKINSHIAVPATLPLNSGPIFRPVYLERTYAAGSHRIQVNHFPTSNYPSSSTSHVIGTRSQHSNKRPVERTGLLPK